MDLKIVGTRQPKIDAWERVSGKGKFASDIYLPGMLYGRILRSPHPHAKVANIDVSKAARLNGVRAILTPKDVPSYRWHKDMPILTDVARFEGDDIAAVAAADEDTAQEALDLISGRLRSSPLYPGSRESLVPGRSQDSPRWESHWRQGQYH
ncbi:MAG: hypothetical protein ACM3TN_17590 [Alphaproteobacteria bacterium]